MFFHKILSLIAVLCAAISVTNAQNTAGVLNIMRYNGVDLNIQKLYEDYLYDYNEYVRLYLPTKADGRVITGHSVPDPIVSRDSNFFMLIETMPISSIMDSIKNKSWIEFGDERRIEDGYGIGRWRTWKPNDYHINYLLFLLSVQQKTFNFDKDTLVHYYTHTESREMFNADTVIRVDIDLPRFYDGKQTFHYESRHYNHMQAYFIHRHNHGFFTLFCFTNDEGQRDFAKHFKALQQIFRYKDDEQTN